MLKFQWLEVPQYVPVQKLVKIGTLNLLLLRIKEEKNTQYAVKTFKPIFSKWPPPHMQPSKTRYINIL